MQSTCRQTTAYAPRDDCSPSQEEHPDPVPTVPIVLNHLLLVRKPVFIPAVKSCAIVDAKDVDILHLKAGRLNLLDNPAERA